MYKTGHYLFLPFTYKQQPANLALSPHSLALIMNQFDAYHAKLLIVPSGSNIGSVLSDQIMLTCRAALYKRNTFTIALSGGSVPKLLQNLSQHFTDVKFDPQWEKWHVLLADERCVVSTHEDSNLNSIRCNFTNDVPIPIGKFV